MLSLSILIMLGRLRKIRVVLGEGTTPIMMLNVLPTLEFNFGHIRIHQRPQKKKF